MSLRIRIAFIALIAVLGVAGGLAVPVDADAREAKPCWKLLLDDWVVDGRIDKAYPASCYREAIKHLPEDLEGYSSAREDIERALAASAGGGGGEGGDDPNRVIPPPVDQPPAQPLPEVETDGGVAATSEDESLFDKLLPRATGAESVPLPLLVLAGLALLLLAAAGVSFAARRLQARRVAAGSPPGPPV